MSFGIKRAANLMLFILGQTFPRGWGFFTNSPQNLSPCSGAFTTFRPQRNTNPHMCPEVGGVGVHFDWCIGGSF